MNGCLPEVREGKSVLQTPIQALRQCDRQVNKKAALLVGNGLTAAAKMKSPTVGKGTETGERVAKPEPLYRTSGGSKRLHKQFCEGSPGMAESRSPTAVRDYRVVKDVK